MLSVQNRLDSSGMADLDVRHFENALHLRHLTDSETMRHDGAFYRSLQIKMLLLHSKTQRIYFNIRSYTVHSCKTFYDSVLKKFIEPHSMKKLFCLCLLLACTTVFAQKYTISGYIEDATTGEKLISATVFETNKTLGTVSNTYGFYSLTLPSDSVEIQCSYIGYNPVVKKILLDKDIAINFSLQPAVDLEEVVVRSSSTEKVTEKTQMSTIEVPIQQIKSLPALGGEVDILKVIQLLPGVQSGSEGSSGIYVRGGGPDQNLILLDGVPVYNVSHLFGFFSVFNADAVKNISIIKGGYPARYGGRLSSVLTINMKEGNMKEFHGEGSIGLISSKLTLEGPIIRDKTSFIISGRRTYLDLLTRPIIKAANKQNGTSGTAGYYFYDVNAKVNHKISDKDRLFLSFYAGRDKGFFVDEYEGEYTGDYRTEYKDKEDLGLGWGNSIAALRWNHQFSPKLFANTTLTYTNYDFLTKQESSYERTNYAPDSTFTELNSSTFQYGSKIKDWGGKIDFDYVPSPQHYFRFGVNGIYHTFEPGVLAFNETSDFGTIDTSFSADVINGTEAYVYIEDDIKITPRLKSNVGLHASLFNVDGETYTSLQPRISVRYMINENWSAKVSYANMTQYLHLLSTSGLSLPTDLWVPSTDSIGPQNSWQVAGGLAHTFQVKEKDDYEISIEGYYKEMNNLITYKEGASYILVADSWENKVTVGKGWSYGAEFFLQKKKGRTTGWVGYTLSWTWRQFDEINFGEKYPYKYDRRHDLSIAVVHEINDRIDITGAFVYGTGNSITLPLSTYDSYPNYILDYGDNQNGGYYNSYNNEVYQYGGKNNYRMAAYHRLDIGVNFHKKKKWGERTWSFSVYNTYNRKNPFFIYRGIDRNTNQDAFQQVSLFPVIPSFSYAFKF